MSTNPPRECTGYRFKSTNTRNVSDFNFYVTWSKISELIEKIFIYTFQCRKEGWSTKKLKAVIAAPLVFLFICMCYPTWRIYKAKGKRFLSCL